MTLWTSQEAVAATGGLASRSWQASGVSIDTRSLQPGDLFVALKDVRDGHDFVAQALQKGAAAALVTHRPADVPEDAPLLVVDDVLNALEALGQAARARTSARIVAITGSVGKTSTKEMLAQMLGAQGRTHASVASYNNHWGVPLTLARMPRDTEYGVIEIGMNHPGEIAPLARMARPHVALITTVAAAHLEAFDSIDGIAREKASIMDGLEPGGAAILNMDIDQADILTHKASEMGARAIGFGRQARHYRLEDVTVRESVTVAQAQVDGAALMFRIQTIGQHFVMNGLAALAACDALGADPALSVQALGRWSPHTGRGARSIIHLDPIERDLTLELIDDAYNANPASMAAALDVLAAAAVRDGTGRVRRGRRIAILGDMKELGPQADRLHRDLASQPALAAIDKVHCIGPLMRSLHAALPEDKRGLWAATSQQLQSQLRQLLDSGDVVLAKGSLSMGLAVIVDAIRKMGHAPPQDDE